MNIVIHGCVRYDNNKYGNNININVIKTMNVLFLTSNSE